MDIKYLLALNTPAFTTCIADCAPSNSSPYVIGWKEFCGAKLAVRRDELRSALSRMVEALPQHGIASPIIMLGGSFLREGDATHPRDMDAVVFYETISDERPTTLSRFQRKIQGLGDLDVRFMPLDLAAIDVIKLAAYFATLFAASKTDKRGPNGVIMLDMAR
ncbi:hypothetical protein M2410_000359 [Stenotrophomonas chelatiphaga]|uniref:DUF6932 family protein n=1 Tax=Stenotrophomonas chelatiphaga TaxID=517011 RepID=UPI0011CDDAA1|nr:hypothetical protein [Stenotrophomonas chelatiphaga]MCS4229656.1 hypothetical protein [Stenotrophomonas chelatiphaga]